MKKIKIPPFEREDHPSGYSPRLILVIAGLYLGYLLMGIGLGLIGTTGFKSDKMSLWFIGIPVLGTSIYVLGFALAGIWLHMFKKQVITYAIGVVVLLLAGFISFINYF